MTTSNHQYNQYNQRPSKYDSKRNNQHHSQKKERKVNETGNCFVMGKHRKKKTKPDEMPLNQINKINGKNILPLLSIHIRY